MLRLFVLLLMLLNAGYFAWTQGLLAPYGLAPEVQTELQRIAQQIRPESFRLLSQPEVVALQAQILADEQRAKTVPLAANEPTQCLQAGLFDAIQTEALRSALKNTLPDGAWLLDSAMEPGRWLVYLGKFANANALDKRRAELMDLKLKPTEMRTGKLALGLSLGDFESQAAADAYVAEVVKKGVKTAKVVREREEVRGTLLRLPAVTPSLQNRLNELKPALVGKTLGRCG